MKSLLYLSLLKVKGTVRNQFRTPASALITIFLIFLYGGLVIMAFAASSDNPAAGGTVDTNTAILIGIGMTAIFAFTVMLNKRKALVYDTDAYYLFAGPYTRKQINGYILFQSLRQGVLYGLLGCYMIAMFYEDNQAKGAKIWLEFEMVARWQPFDPQVLMDRELIETAWEQYRKMKGIQKG